MRVIDERSHLREHSRDLRVDAVHVRIGEAERLDGRVDRCR